MAHVIDSDQHLFEPRDLWRRYADPGDREDALAILDDELGHAWLTWRGRRLGIADVQWPGETDAIGERRRREREGEPPLARYDEILPRDYWDPAARLKQLGVIGVDEAICFPNYGLAWERILQRDLRALTANMGAWNRWCATVVEEGAGRLHPVAHLTLRDDASPDEVLGVLLVTGRYAGWVERATSDNRESLGAQLARAGGDVARLRRILACEASYAIRNDDGDPYVIRHSSFPFRESRALDVPTLDPRALERTDRLPSRREGATWCVESWFVQR